MELDILKLIESQGIVTALLIYMMYRQRETDNFMKEKFCKLFDAMMQEVGENGS